MCGICGVIRFDNQSVLEPSIREMMRIMKHRGPDDEGIFLENTVGLGFVRLSILDLSLDGHQPMYSYDKKYVIIFNGEIFNYIELREELIEFGYSFVTQTDTEVLLKGYIHWGEDCLNHFNGMWAFTIYDREKNTTFIARDRFGIKPFYYLKTKEYFAFCSEIPPLLSLIDKKPTPDYQTIFDFLTFSRTDQTENTFFSQIKKLQHGCSLTIGDQHAAIDDQYSTIKEWYNLREHVSKANGFRNPDEYKDLLCSALELHLRSDVPVGVCLSGGLDSSSIVSLYLQDKNTSLNTFSAVYGKGQTGDEMDFINEFRSSLINMYFTNPTSENLANDLVKFVKLHGEPIPSTSPYAQFKVMELAQGKVVVTLDGQGADEELAGYHYFFGFYFKDLLTHGRLGKLGIEIYYYLKKHQSMMGIKSFLFFMLPKRLCTYLNVNAKGYLIKDFVAKFKDSNSVAGNLYGSKNLSEALLDHFEYKLEHLLKWEDRNSMWFSLESRVPFLDYRLVEKTLATSGDLKIKGGMTKSILREAMKGILPEKIRLRRDKIGFETPQKEWFRTPTWQSIIEEILFSQSFKNRNILNPEIVLKKFKKHLEGKINCASEIWKWIHLELWFREFID
jgi:asparagine synthase (glutamine-hydrolysing)